MSKFIGIDLGTISITAVLIDIGSVDDPDRHPVRRQLSVDNQSQRDRPEHPIYSEWDLDQMINSAFGLLADLVDGMPTQEIAGIGVTEQAHGMRCLTSVIDRIQLLLVGKISVEMRSIPTI